jgi:uncharacterized membrane protein
MKAIIAAAAAASLAAFAPGMVSAQAKAEAAGISRGRPNTVDIQVCNRSGRDATVAVSYVEAGSGAFVNRGWYDVLNGACAQLASTDNANFYVYADATDGSGRSWQGDHVLCVEYPGPYTFPSTGSTTCEYGQETRKFVPIHADGPGPYTWNLDP